MNDYTLVRRTEIEQQGSCEADLYFITLEELQL